MEFVFPRLVFLGFVSVFAEVSRASVPVDVPSTTSTSLTWADHLRLSLSVWQLLPTSVSLGRPVTVTHTTRSFSNNNLLPFVLEIWPALLNSSLCTSSSLRSIRVPSLFPILPPTARNFSRNAAACSHSRLRSLSISAKDSKVVSASCRAILSSCPGGVSFNRSWRRRMNCGNLWMGLTIRPKKLSRSWAVICFTWNINEILGTKAMQIWNKTQGQQRVELCGKNSIIPLKLE